MTVPAVASLAIGIAACAGQSSYPAQDKLAALEKNAGGRLGVCALDPVQGRMIGHRMHERFALCSTFKLPLVALILREADAGRLSLDSVVEYSQEDIVSFAPVTAANLGKGGMTIRALAEAAQVRSDNVAANLLLGRIGGPAGFTAKLRTLGDSQTRLDRFEPALNLVPEGEVRDTTTPRAMAQTVASILSGTVLRPASRQILVEWMRSTRTGAKRIRGGFPEDWPSGDKTGTAIASGMANKYNDVAAAWPSGSRLIVVAGYYEADGAYDEIRDRDQSVLAKVGEIAANWFAV